MEIKLIALDLDDTTLNSSAALADETRDTLLRAAKEGIEVVVASGRAFTSLPKSVLELEGVNYAITSNGSAVEMAKTGQRVYACGLSSETVREILDAYPDAMFECFIEGQPYCVEEYMSDPVKYGCHPAYVSYVQTTRRPIKDMRTFIEQNLDRLDSVDVLCPTPEIKADFYARGRRIKNAYATSSSERLVEFASADAGKGKTLRWLCDKLGIAAENVAAFGNGDNDADMLVFAGLGVAVRNATPFCRESADYVCESNDELGVAKTLRKILNNEPIPTHGPLVKGGCQRS